MIIIQKYGIIVRQIYGIFKFCLNMACDPSQIPCCLGFINPTQYTES